MWFKQVVPSGELKGLARRRKQGLDEYIIFDIGDTEVFGASAPHHAGCAPYISGCAVSCADENLQGAVLPRLDVFSKVLVLNRRRWEKNNVGGQFASKISSNFIL